VGDLPLGGRPVVLAWPERIWRCRQRACAIRTWTERGTAIGPRAVLNERRSGRGMHAGGSARMPMRLMAARDFSVTIMLAVHKHSSPLVDVAACLEGVAAFGLDETGVFKATCVAPTP
jgi:hypothetical protein